MDIERGMEAAEQEKLIWNTADLELYLASARYKNWLLPDETYPVYILFNSE